jgi:hypothetical protein
MGNQLPSSLNVSEPPGVQSCFEALEGVTVSRFLRSNNTMDMEQLLELPGARARSMLPQHTYTHTCASQTRRIACNGMHSRGSMTERSSPSIPCYGIWKERTPDAVELMSQNTDARKEYLQNGVHPRGSMTARSSQSPVP